MYQFFNLKFMSLALACLGILMSVNAADIDVVNSIWLKMGGNPETVWNCSSKYRAAPYIFIDYFFPIHF